MPGLGGPGDGSRPVRPAPGARGQAGSPTWRPGRRGACVHPRPWPRCRSAGPGVGQASSHLWAPACAPPLGTRPAWRTSTRGSSNASPRLTPCCCGWPGRPPWACPATAAHVAPPCAAPAQWSSPPPVSPTAHHQGVPVGACGLGRGVRYRRHPGVALVGSCPRSHRRRSRRLPRSHRWALPR